MSLVARAKSLANRDALTRVGLALTAAWLLLVLLFWLLGPTGTTEPSGLGRLVRVMGLVLPLALIWVGVSLGRSIEILRAEAADLRQQLGRPAGQDGHGRDAARAPMPAPAPRPAAPSSVPAPPAAPPPAPAAPSALATRPRPGDQRQTAMRFEPGQAQAQAPAPIDVTTLIRALNFPDGPDDHEAIDALRQALRDPDLSRVLRSAQDVVTLLAGHDVYMDMLPPNPASAAVWRRFAEGQRGSGVAGLGGIHDREALETVAQMMRQDEIFRDTAHHFLRHFDGLLARLVPELDELQIAVLADSRSARAFMLLGRVAGSFG